MTSFERKDIYQAIVNGNTGQDAFNNLMQQEDFLNAGDLYNAAVSVIHSYKNAEDVPAIKRAYEVLTNSKVKSLPTNQNMLFYAISILGYNKAKSRSEEIITTEFSKYLETVAKENTPGIILEKKLVGHDKEVEAFLKMLGLPESEWKELKHLLAVKDESSAIQKWNEIISLVRSKNVGLFSGTRQVEDFLLGNLTVQHLVEAKTHTQAKFLGVYPLILRSPVIKMHPEHWAALQLSLLKGDNEAFEKLLLEEVFWSKEGIGSDIKSQFINLVSDTETTLRRNYPNLDYYNTHPSFGISSYLLSEQRNDTPLHPGTVRPVVLHNLLYFMTQKPKELEDKQRLFNEAAENNVSIIVDLHANEEMDTLLPSAEARVLSSRTEDIPGTNQKITIATVAITLENGKEKIFNILRASGWESDEARFKESLPKVQSLERLATEVTKLEKETKGKLLVTSENPSRVPIFMIYHHTIQDPGNRTIVTGESIEHFDRSIKLDKYMDVEFLTDELLPDIDNYEIVDEE